MFKHFCEEIPEQSNIWCLIRDPQTVQIEQALIIVVHNTMPSSYMKPYTADRKSHDPVMM